MATLVDLYVATVVGQVPRHRRPDIERELRSLISEEVEALGAETAEGERTVLTRMGSPDLLAAEYARRRFSPVGPRYFREYTRRLTIWLCVSVPLTFVLVFLASVLTERDLFDHIRVAGSASVTVGLFVAGAITVVYFIKDRRDSDKAGEAWSPESLNVTREHRRAAAVSAAVVIAILVALILLIAAQQFISPFDDSLGNPVPIINPGLWSWWIPVIIGLFLIQIIRNVVLCLTPQWDRQLAWTNLVIQCLSVLIAGVLLITDQFVNPAYVSEVGIPWSGFLFLVFSGIFLAVIAGTAIVDTVTAFMRAYRNPWR